MGWEDRPYYRDRGSGGGGSFLAMANGSLSLGMWFGINVRVSFWLILLIILNVLFPGQLGGFSMSIEMTAVLFGTVLLHEFGHCYGSYLVGGRPVQIIMHPLGGLASADPPHRAWPTFITVAAGPMVDVIICVLTAVAVRLIYGVWAVLPWNPMGMSPEYLYSVAFFPPALRHLWIIFSVNYAVLLFNLLPIFPFDGGQLMQSLLWVKLGYYRATVFATLTGMIGGSMLGVYGLMNRSLLLVLIAVSGFITCFYIYKELKANGRWAYQEDESPFATALVRGERENRRESAKAAKRSEKAAQQAEKLQREEAAEQAEIDDILAKVSAHGMASLTNAEKKALQRATERQRARDAEMTKLRRQR